MEFSYEEMKLMYSKFKSELPDDLFYRYSQELKHVRMLIPAAQKQGLDDDVFEYQKIEQNDLEQLRNMGYKIK